VNVPLFERFTITDEKSGYIVFLDKMENYKEFYVSFTHSVNRTPVNEYYVISDGRFKLEKATFYSYGAGMPELGEYGSNKPIIVNGMVEIDNINKEFEKFTYYAGTYANHCLNNSSSKIPFLQFVKPQTPVTFEIRKVSLYKIISSFWMKN
jgi:hypothetical protein